MSDAVGVTVVEGPLGPSPYEQLRKLRALNDALSDQLAALCDRCERLQQELAEARRDVDYWRREAWAADMEAV